MDLTESSLRQEYNRRYPHLELLKNKIVDELNRDLETIDYVDGIFGRVKKKSSFVKKVLSDPQEYSNPFRFVEDIIGVRILVLFPTTSSRVSTRIKEGIFSSAENEYRQEKSEKAFGYEGYQSIHSFPPSIEVQSEFEDLPKVFELQVRTLYQHAWAESDHEINYKRDFEFPDEIEEREYKRSFAWLAASCWGSDKVLDDLFRRFSAFDNEAS